MKAQFQEMFGLRKHRDDRHKKAAPLGDEPQGQTSWKSSLQDGGHDDADDSDEQEFDITDLLVVESPHNKPPPKSGLADAADITKERLHQRLSASLTAMDFPPPTSSSHHSKEEPSKHGAAARKALRPPTKDTPTYNNKPPPPNTNDAKFEDMTVDDEFDAHVQRLQGGGVGAGTTHAAAPAPAPFPLSPDRRPRLRQAPPARTRSRSLTDVRPEQVHKDNNNNNNNTTKTTSKHRSSSGGSRLTSSSRQRKPPRKSAAAETTTTTDEPLFHPFPKTRSNHKPQQRPHSAAASAASRSTKRSQRSRAAESLAAKTLASAPPATSSGYRDRSTTTTTTNTSTGGSSHHGRGRGLGGGSGHKSRRDASSTGGMPRKHHSEGARRRPTGTSYKAAKMTQDKSTQEAESPPTQSYPRVNTDPDGGGGGVSTSLANLPNRKSSKHSKVTTEQDVEFLEPADESVTSDEWSKADRSQREKWKQKHLSASPTPPYPRNSDNEDEELVLDLAEKIPSLTTGSRRSAGRIKGPSVASSASSGHSSTAAKRRAKEAKRRMMEKELAAGAWLKDKDNDIPEEPETSSSQQQRGRENRRATLARTRSRSLTDLKRPNSKAVAAAAAAGADGDGEWGEKGRTKAESERDGETKTKGASRRGMLARTRSRSLTDMKRAGKKDAADDGKSRRSTRKTRANPSIESSLKRPPSSGAKEGSDRNLGGTKTGAKERPKEGVLDDDPPGHGSLATLDSINAKDDAPYTATEINGAVAAAQPERPGRRERGVQRTRSRSLSDMHTSRRGGRKPEANVLSSARKEYKTAGAIADGKTSSSVFDWIAHGKQALERFESRNEDNVRKIELEEMSSTSTPGDEESSHTRRRVVGPILAAQSQKDVDLKYKRSATVDSPVRRQMERTRSRSLTDLASGTRRGDSTASATDDKDDIFHCGDDEREIARLREKLSKLEQDLLVIGQLEESAIEQVKEKRRLMVKRESERKSGKTTSPTKDDGRGKLAASAGGGGGDDELERLTQAANMAKSIIKYLKGENEQHREEQKALKVKMFDMYQSTLRLESATEKTHAYFSQLEALHRAELTKNQALEKNVPAFRKVVEAHELKLARRLRYVKFERQTTMLYIRNMRAIVRKFQAQCQDRKLVRYLERMAGLDQTHPFLEEPAVAAPTTATTSSGNIPVVHNTKTGNEKNNKEKTLKEKEKSERERDKEKQDNKSQYNGFYRY